MGGIWGRFQPLFQDLCSTGKNKQLVNLTNIATAILDCVAMVGTPRKQSELDMTLKAARQAGSKLSSTHFPVVIIGEIGSEAKANSEQQSRHIG